MTRGGMAAVALLLAWGGSQALAQTAPETVPAPVVNSALNAPLFYQLLLGEINVREGDPGALATRKGNTLLANFC